MKNNVRKRIGAFLLDMFIIIMISVTLSNLSYLNPYKDSSYEESYTEYNQALDNFEESINNISNKLTSSKGRVEIDYKDSFNILNDEVMPSLIRLEKYNTFNSLWYLIIFMLYFCLFAYFNYGQTLGKKLFKIKVVNKGEEKVSLVRLFIRSLFTGSSLFYGINIILILRILIQFIPSIKVLSFIYYFIQLISLAFELALFITLFTSKGKCLISDKLAKTEVIDAK